jgi:hypothetical protein
VLTVETEPIVDNPLRMPTTPPDTAPLHVAADPHEGTSDPGPAVTLTAMDETMIRGMTEGPMTIDEEILTTGDRAMATRISTDHLQGVRSTITMIGTARSETATEEITEIVDRTIETGTPESASDIIVLSDLGMPISRGMTPPRGRGAPVETQHLVYGTMTVEPQIHPTRFQ